MVMGEGSSYDDHTAAQSYAGAIRRALPERVTLAEVPPQMQDAAQVVIDAHEALDALVKLAYLAVTP